MYRQVLLNYTDLFTVIIQSFTSNNIKSRNLRQTVIPSAAKKVLVLMGVLKQKIQSFLYKASLRLVDDFIYILVACTAPPAERLDYEDDENDEDEAGDDDQYHLPRLDTTAGTYRGKISKKSNSSLDKRNFELC